jgi:hypothetical protein
MEKFFLEIGNQKQELPVVAMFVNRSGQNEQYLKDDQELNNYLLQEAVNDANLFTNAQAPAISGIALETAVKDYYEIGGCAIYR